MDRIEGERDRNPNPRTIETKSERAWKEWELGIAEGTENW